MVAAKPREEVGIIRANAYQGLESFAAIVHTPYVYYWTKYFVAAIGSCAHVGSDFGMDFSAN